MIEGFHHVGMNTADLDRLADFYRRLFGFEAVEEPRSWVRDRALIARLIGAPETTGRMAMLRAGNIYLEIFEFAEPAATAVAPLKPWDRGYTHVCLAVRDINAEYARLVGLGMRFLQDGPLEVGRVKAAYGFDPDGNMIELIQTKADHPFAFHRLAR